MEDFLLTWTSGQQPTQGGCILLQPHQQMTTTTRRILSFSQLRQRELEEEEE
jgi:hypothetical protein